MPLLDVSDLCSDPDFASRIKVQRRQVIAGANGRDTYQIIPLSGVGVVLPDPEAGMTRTPDEQTVPAAITVHTTLRLQGEATGYQADLVLWRGAQYVVSRLYDYSHFGAGFVSAYCVSEASTEPQAR